MKVLMVHVGDPVETKDAPDPARHIEMVSLNDGDMRIYRKKDMINAVSQMRSLQVAGIEIEYGVLSGRKSLPSLFRAGVRLRQVARAKEVDLVHVLWGVTSSLIAVMFSPVPVVISFCGSDLYGYPDVTGKRTFRAMVTRFLSRVSALFAKQIITKSEAMKDLLFAPSRRKVTVIPNGVDLNAFAPMSKIDARRQLAWPLDKKIVLFFPGDGGTVKDLPLAQSTFALLQLAEPNVELMLVRGVAHDQLVYFYNSADLMLLTSFHEGSNNSVKEALACNLPIVSVSCGDTAERLRGVQNSHVVRSRDPNELARMALDVLKSGQRSNGCEAVREISLERVAEKVRDVYAKAVAKDDAASVCGAR